MTDLYPQHATTREAELFALANHYRQILEFVLAASRRSSTLYSSTLRRDIAMRMNQAPLPDHLYYQAVSIELAPRDGSMLILLCKDREEPVKGRYCDKRYAWETDRHELISPHSYVPIGSAARQASYPLPRSASNE